MVEASIPQVYWAGYESLVLVSAHFIAKWSVIVAKDPISNLFPRRWLDIKGNKVPCFWQAALRAVMGSVIFRPGISQVKHLTYIFPPTSPHLFSIGRNQMAASVCLRPARSHGTFMVPASGRVFAISHGTYFAL